MSMGDLFCLLVGEWGIISTQAWLARLAKLAKVCYDVLGKQQGRKHMSVMEEDTEDTYLTTSEVAKELRVSMVTVQKLLATNEMKGTRVGKVWRVRKSDLIDFMNRNTNTK